MKCTNGVENILVYRRTNELVHEKKYFMYMCMNWTNNSVCVPY